MASTLLLAVVFVFDLIAFALAIAAEQRKTSASLAQNETTSYCVYNSDISTGLGIGSVIFLSASQLNIMFASHCLCFGKALTPGRSRTWAIFLFISCWVSYLIAGSCLLAGSVKNAYHTKYSTLISDQPPSCEVMRKGVFGAGAAFIVLTGIFSELFYVRYTKVDGRHVPNFPDSGIRMGAFN